MAEAGADRARQRGDGEPEASPLERALVLLLDASVAIAPDDLPDAVARAGSLLGGRDTVVLLADLAQVTLHPMAGGAAGAGPEAHPVDASPAGTAFRTEAPVTEPAGGGGVRLWVPILDSAERIGVVTTVVDDVSAGVLRRWALLASLVGELVVTKGRYGDAVDVTRRSRPLSLAAEMRWALLPPLTYTSSDVVVSGILEPAYTIAGDTFDYAVNGRTVHVALFDAMGHGLEASRMANLAVGQYRNGRRRGEALPDIVRAIDEVIQDQFPGSRFVTGQLAELDIDTGSIAAINAGHPPARVFHRDGTCAELTGARSRPMGIDADPGTAVVTQLRPGDVLLFHTDGVTDSRNHAGEFFGTERLDTLVAELLADDVRPAEVLRRVVAAVLAHQQVLRDDATLVLLGWRLGPGALPPVHRG